MMSSKTLLLVAALLILFLPACNGAQEILLITPTTEMLITAIPTNTAVPPTPLPPPTSTHYPTATPEGFIPTPTRIATSGLLSVVVDEEVTDGLRVRTGPGYVCESIADPTCNVIDAFFPSDENFRLMTVDTTTETAWCEYNRFVPTNPMWSACEFLVPTTVEDCEKAFEQEIAQYLAECRQGEAG